MKTIILPTLLAMFFATSTAKAAVVSSSGTITGYVVSECQLNTPTAPNVTLGVNGSLFMDLQRSFNILCNEDTPYNVSFSTTNTSGRYDATGSQFQTQLEKMPAFWYYGTVGNMQPMGSVANGQGFSGTATGINQAHDFWVRLNTEDGSTPSPLPRAGGYSLWLNYTVNY